MQLRKKQYRVPLVKDRAEHMQEELTRIIQFASENGKSPEYDRMQLINPEIFDGNSDIQPYILVFYDNDIEVFRGKVTFTTVKEDGCILINCSFGARNMPGGRGHRIPDGPVAQTVGSSHTRNFAVIGRGGNGNRIGKWYNSKVWKNCWVSYIWRVFGLCEQCGAGGYMVHHKIILTPENIHDPEVSLNWDHLQYQCQDCHNREHHGSAESVVRDGLVFNAYGDLVEDTGDTPAPPIKYEPRRAPRTEGETSKNAQEVSHDPLP